MVRRRGREVDAVNRGMMPLPLAGSGTRVKRRRRMLTFLQSSVIFALFGVLQEEKTGVADATAPEVRSCGGVQASMYRRGNGVGGVRRSTARAVAVENIPCHAIDHRICAQQCGDPFAASGVEDLAGAAREMHDHPGAALDALD